MARCFLCGKGKQYGISRTHRRGVAGGQWKKKAPKTQKVFKPNLQKFQGKMYCSKCLRKVKAEATKVKPVSKVPESSLSPAAKAA